MGELPIAPGMPGHRRSMPIYVAAGFASVAGHYATTIAAVELAGVAPLTGSIAGFCVGAVIKYLLNYFMAFRSAERHSAALVKFAVAVAAMFALNTAIFALLQQGLGLHYMLAQVLTTGLIVPPGYLLSRLWVFAAARRTERA